MPFNLTTGEVLVILFVALLVLGPTKLPEAARQVGRAITEFRRMSSGFQSELRDALKEPVEGVPQTAATLPPPEDPDADHEGTAGPTPA